MKQTPNYNLKKIEISDAPADITVDSGNMDIIDTEPKKAENHSNNANTHVTTADKSNWSSKAAGSHSHPKSQITDFPTSLPANGGNADTVDGKHASAFLGAGATAADSLKLGGRTAIGYPHVDYIEPVINGTTYYGMCFTAYYSSTHYTQIFLAWAGNRFTRVVFNGNAGSWQSF